MEELIRSLFGRPLMANRRGALGTPQLGVFPSFPADAGDSSDHEWGRFCRAGGTVDFIHMTRRAVTAAAGPTLQRDIWI